MLIENIDFQIFDRWGSIVFDTTHPTGGWTGKNKDLKAAQGVYIWRMEANINLCGQQIKLRQQGEILLVR